jgi:hypothetical protein
MAKVLDNPITEGLSGRLGRSRLQFRKGRNGKTIVALNPVFSEDRVVSDAQLAQQDAFRLATQYAVVAKDHPVYANLAKGGAATAYNFAVADYFGEPKVLDIDISNWTGQVGQEIRVRATDDTLVSRVHVMIRVSNATPTVLEEGDAIRSTTDGLLWVYTTKTAISMNPGTRLDVMAYDLPGNTGADSLELS